ncbi:hypothetical protein F2Q70_00022321 [Brassica cretica]|uniref:Uncharacterized protein n=1 Tax=Brassica cretica TaxID=69181 RepID=A0A8S9GHF0_BRACR|nr:hypothetical protein F2Q70_00022321 [Brassica cretica]
MLFIITPIHSQYLNFFTILILASGRWAFNADDVVLPSPSTSVEESLAYFISNGFDVWYMTTFLDSQVRARFLNLLLATGTVCHSNTDSKDWPKEDADASKLDRIKWECRLIDKSPCKRHGTAKGTMDVKERVPLLAKKSNEPSTSSSGQRLCHPPAVKKEVPAEGERG